MKQSKKYKNDDNIEYHYDIIDNNSLGLIEKVNLSMIIVSNREFGKVIRRLDINNIKYKVYSLSYNVIAIITDNMESLLNGKWDYIDCDYIKYFDIL